MREMSGLEFTLSQRRQPGGSTRVAAANPSFVRKLVLINISACLIHIYKSAALFSRRSAAAHEF